MDQLIREDNPFAGKTYVYTYDLGGNLLTKTTYAYTQPNSTPNNPLSTVTYGNGYSRSYEYDLLGRVVAQKQKLLYYPVEQPLN